MKWLAPLIIVVILVIIGAWFCSSHPEPAKPPANTKPANANANSNANASANANANINANSNTNAPANSNLSGTVSTPGQ